MYQNRGSRCVKFRNIIVRTVVLTQQRCFLGITMRRNGKEMRDGKTKHVQKSLKVHSKVTGKNPIPISFVCQIQMPSASPLLGGVELLTHLPVSGGIGTAAHWCIEFLMFI